MVSSGMMLTGFGALAVGALAVGALGVKYSYQFSRFNEQMDSIGSTTPMDEVEPASWKVIFTQLCFGIVGVVGALAIIMSLFLP